MANRDWWYVVIRGVDGSLSKLPTRTDEDAHAALLQLANWESPSCILLGAEETTGTAPGPDVRPLLIVKANVVSATVVSGRELDDLERAQRMHAAMQSGLVEKMISGGRRDAGR